MRYFKQRYAGRMAVILALCAGILAGAGLTGCVKTTGSEASGLPQNHTLGTASRSPEREGASDSSGAARTAPLAGARQLILVVSRDWSAFNAVMLRYERDTPASAWKPVGGPIPVVIGKNGLAWGRGLHGEAAGPGPVKREGDKKSPAGAFSLGEAFAYEPGELDFIPAMPMKRVGEETICVENAGSRYYNVILDKNEAAEPDWIDPDQMRRPDGLYRYGFFVNHNFPNPAPGAGSCIFFHIWRGPNQYSVGCTAMTRENLLEVLRWLDASKHPAVVQLPRKEAQEYARVWDYPAPAGLSFR